MGQGWCDTKPQPVKAPPPPRGQRGQGNQKGPDQQQLRQIIAMHGVPAHVADSIIAATGSGTGSSGQVRTSRRPLGCYQP